MHVNDIGGMVGIQLDNALEMQVSRCWFSWRSEKQHFVPSWWWNDCRWRFCRLWFLRLRKVRVGVAVVAGICRLWFLRVGKEPVRLGVFAGV